MKRKFTQAPAWADYIYQFVDWVDNNTFSRISSFLLNWRINFLDKHCQCLKCIDRRKEAQ